MWWLLQFKYQKPRKVEGILEIHLNRIPFPFRWSGELRPEPLTRWRDLQGGSVDWGCHVPRGLPHSPGAPVSARAGPQQCLPLQCVMWARPSSSPTPGLRLPVSWNPDVWIPSQSGFPLPLASPGWAGGARRCGRGAGGLVSSFLSALPGKCKVPS